MRLAAYAVCVVDDRVLLAHYRGTHWTLPGGRVEHAEDPIDTVVREIAEETGYEATVDRLLGVDSRVIPAAEANRGEEHQNIGIFYAARITGGRYRPEPNGETTESLWLPLADVPREPRAGLVDIGLALARIQPPTGHVPPIRTGGLIQH